MKKLLAILLALCMLLSLVACSQAPAADAPAAEAPKADAPAAEAPAAKDPDPVTIRFWQAGGDTVGASSVMRLLLDKFELQNPGIKVEYQAIPWSNDPHTIFQTGIAGGDIADILVVGSPLDFQLAGNGQVLALDDLLDEDDDED